MESCSFSTFLIFLRILNYYLDQLMPSSIIKDLMDPLLSVDYTWSKMQEILSTRCVTQKLSIINDLLVKNLNSTFFLHFVQCSLFRFEIQTLLRKILVRFTSQLPFQRVIVVFPSPPFGNRASTENTVWAIIYIGYPFDGSGSKGRKKGKLQGGIGKWKEKRNTVPYPGQYTDQKLEGLCVPVSKSSREWEQVIVDKTAAHLFACLFFNHTWGKDD